MKQRSLLIVAAAAVLLAMAAYLIARRPAGGGGTATVPAALIDLGVVEPAAKQSFQPDHAQIQAVLALPKVAAPLDPRWTAFVLGHVREGLVRRGPQGHAEPGAAASWEVVSERELRFKLRPGLKWSDGSPLTAAQFVATWTRRAHHQLAEARADDDATITVKLTADAPAAAQMLPLMAGSAWAPLAGDGDPAAAELSGPFNGPFVPARGGDGFVLSRNGNYWANESVGIDQLAAMPMPGDKKQLVDDFLAGKLAYAEGLGSDPELINRAGAYVHRAFTGGVVVMVLNRKAPELKSANFRRGLRVAINRSDLELYTAKDGGIAAMHGLVPPLLPGIFANYGAEYNVIFDTNPRLAEAYFAKARKDGKGGVPKTVSVLAEDVPANHAELDHLAAWLAVNHNLTLKPAYVAPSGMPAALKAGKYAVAYLRLDPHASDAAAYLEQFRAAPLGDVVQLSAPARAKLDAVAQAKDERARFNAVSEAERALIADDYLIGIAQDAAPYLIDPKLSGVVRGVAGADPDFTRARASEAVAASAPNATPSHAHSP